MTGSANSIALRLASAQRKIRAFLRQLADIESGEFPHPDGKGALQDIREYFERTLAGVESLPATATTETANALCSQANYDIVRHTEILGFILRSTNIRNAFEIQDPLKRIAQRAVRENVRLILSSDWYYSPRTYPMNVYTLPSSVFVGMPAQESRFALPFAIAGHEIGHSVWRHHGLHPRILQAATEAIHRTAVAACKNRVPSDLAGLENLCLAHAMKQAEEIFCDLFGLAVFGESYLYAFDYLLAPGGWLRSLDYPSVLQRNEYLRWAAVQLGISFDHRLFCEWTDSRPLPPEYSEIAAVADQSLKLFALQILKLATRLATGSGLALPAEQKIIEISHSFQRFLPYQRAALLPEILSAGWRSLRAMGGLGKKTEDEKHETLNEIILKSIEISEFRRLVEASDSAC